MSLFGAKGLKLKVRKCWGLMEVTRGKTGRGDFLPPPPIQNRVNLKLKAQKYIYKLAQHEH